MKFLFFKQLAFSAFFACSLSADVPNVHDQSDIALAGDGLRAADHARRLAKSGFVGQGSTAGLVFNQAGIPSFKCGDMRARGMPFRARSFLANAKPGLISVVWSSEKFGVHPQNRTAMSRDVRLVVSAEVMNALMDSEDALFCWPHYRRPLFLQASVWPCAVWFCGPAVQFGVAGSSGRVDMVGMMPRLKKVFMNEGVPQQWVWLAEVESALNPRAKSSAGAVGLFQLMAGTARRFGLDTSASDDRMEPEKSASAAAQYLKILHQEFGCWSLALAAYNAGEGRVREIMKKRKACTFNEVERYLPSETRAYVPKVMAVVAMREDQLNGVPGAYWMP